MLTPRRTAIVLALLLAACAPPQPSIVPPRDSVRLSAPGSGPTEEAPIGVLSITITDQAGRAVTADLTVSLGDVARQQIVQQVHGVSEAEVLIPAKTDTLIWITVEAEGYQTFESGIRPNRFHSFTLDMPVELRPAEVQG